ncbi:MAG: hypothetical protein H7Z42_10525 [Roseiflexaceae bacterium]|nr:hypothetical protein [Roseiflexaceae bacterium]
MSTLTRCPLCSVLVTVEQNMCPRCLEPLAPAAPSTPATGETSTLYRSPSGRERLLISFSQIEYDSAQLGLLATWDNVVALESSEHGHRLRLHHTPARVRLPVSSARTWFSNLTQYIPLEPFGFPNNPTLRADIARCAPHLQQYL